MNKLSDRELLELILSNQIVIGKLILKMDKFLCEQHGTKYKNINQTIENTFEELKNSQWIIQEIIKKATT